MRILVAGVGNVLRGDDAFGIEVARHLEQLALPDGVTVTETGIGGIALVQDLMEGWDALVVVDAVDRGRAPGTVMVIEPEVADLATLPLAARHDVLADVHLANPERVLALARALGVLPAFVRLVGCQPADAEAVGESLSPVVAAAVPVAVAEITRLLNSLALGRSHR